MSFIQQKHKFKISHKESKKDKKLGLFPANIRCIVSGPSGCGKTVLIYNLIVKKEGIKFTNLYIISKTLDQEKYKKITDIFNLCGDDVKLHTFTDCEITPNDVERHSIVVFET